MVVLEERVKHTMIRDYFVYSVASLKYLARRRKLSGYFRELSRFSSWYKFRNSREGTLYYKIPWLVFDSIDFLQNWLKPTMLVVEYGSGGSTLFFAQHVNKVSSLEHDREWFSITKAAIESDRLNNVDYKLIEPAADKSYEYKSYLNPTDCLSARTEFKGKNFSSYVKAINEFKDKAIDLVVVDGRARQSCIAYSIPKIKKGGILLLDNADRDYYLLSNPEMNDKNKWDRKDFLGHFPFAPASILNMTSVFIKLY